jgi:NodT family efflux transporter outer membrane factor (OMF) lipoprotein
MQRAFLSLPAALLSLAAGCAPVGPDYHTPEVSQPEGWSALPSAKPGTGDLSEWWRGFGDARLNWLIGQVLEANLDLRTAAARIDGARAEQLSVVAAFWPRLNASSGYQRMRLSPNAIKGLFGVFETGEEGGASTSALLSRLGPVGRPFNLFQAGFDASWELDLFGGIRRRQEAVEAELAADVEAGRAIMVSLTAETAQTYLELLARRQRRQIAQQRIATQREILRVADSAFAEGFATALDRQRARTELAEAEAALPAFDAHIQRAQHALAVLLGLPPRALIHRLADDTSPVPEPPAIAVGLPSEVLRRRPDIRRAEREAAAANAAVGVASAELFPKLSLTGSVGFQSQELSSFTSLSSGFYGFGPRLSLPIFQAGRLQANVDLQEAELEQAAHQYRKTVLTAFREVEDALASARGEAERRKVLTAADDSARLAASTAEALYREGETDLHTVLDTQRSWLQVRDQIVENRLAWAATHVALYKALGGGWPATRGIRPRGDEPPIAP